jgi:hypothetical protein
MTRTWRLALLLLPVVPGLFLAALPGRAQQAVSSRYAFADTTLLRDTLNLRFEGLFPLADSLSITPDTLRALSIRYRWPLLRLVQLADSLRMPVDSVGVYLQRERFNPLSGAAGQHTTTLNYTSSYNIQQTSTLWGNALDYKLVAGPIVIQNTTNVQMDRYQAGSRTSLRQTRSSSTEGGWKLARGLSVGGRANLDRFNSHDPSSASNQGESKDEFQLSVRSRQAPMRGLTSEMNFYSGLLNVNNTQQIKRGTSADLNGTVRLQTRLVTHDLSGQVTGNLAQTRLPTSPVSVGTNDLSNNLRGTLGVLPGAPVGLNLNYSIRRTRVETPRDSGRAQSVRTLNNSVDASMRMRRSNDKYVNLTARYGSQEQHQGTGLNSLISRKDFGLGTDGRLMLAGCDMQSRFSVTWSRSEYPTRATTGGYGESLRVASVDGTVSRALSRRFMLRATGSVSLTQSRSFVIGKYPNPPVNRDQYRQEYRVEGQYNASERMNTAVALAVTRDVLLNIPAASTNANNEARTYRAEWRWSYRMMRGLTATQNNSVTAAYTHYNFLPDNDRLSMDYNTLTTLNAVLSPRFSVDVRHNARHQPSGSFTVLDDGLTYLSRSEVNESYTLSARLSYSPSQTFSLYLEPDYLASQQNGTQSGTLSPTRGSHQLNFSGGASLNLKVGGKGRLTGDILRTYRADRSLTYNASGAATSSPRSESDYWNGSLQLSWEL